MCRRSAVSGGIARETADRFGVRLAMVDIDLMAYRLIQEPRAFDVIAAPNLFGDILADLGSVLLGSRGLSFSGNFSSDGKAVFQTNHGSRVRSGAAQIAQTRLVRSSLWR